jgi:hypothetical protein
MIKSLLQAGEIQSNYYDRGSVGLAPAVSRFIKTKLPESVSGALFGSPTCRIEHPAFPRRMERVLPPAQRDTGRKIPSTMAELRSFLS